jgi:hypothetical protein
MQDYQRCGTCVKQVWLQRVVVFPFLRSVILPILLYLRSGISGYLFTFPHLLNLFFVWHAKDRVNFWYNLITNVTNPTTMTCPQFQEFQQPLSLARRTTSLDILLWKILITHLWNPKSSSNCTQHEILQKTKRVFLVINIRMQEPCTILASEVVDCHSCGKRSPTIVGCVNTCFAQCVLSLPQFTLLAPMRNTWYVKYWFVTAIAQPSS